MWCLAARSASVLAAISVSGSFPDTTKTSSITITPRLEETTDENGKPCVYLPRLTPKDCYFLYNKDGYYRLK